MTVEPFFNLPLRMSIGFPRSLLYILYRLSIHWPIAKEDNGDGFSTLRIPEHSLEAHVRIGGFKDCTGEGMYIVFYVFH